MQGLSASVLVIAAVATGLAQSPAPQVWTMQDSGTTAGLRGIDSVDGTVAWASGTGGTVLRTVDGGAHWTRCATPDAAKDGATLDFRGVQGWDAQMAIVMASGPGDKSRLYKTADGCGKWNLIFENPDRGGFWDTLRFHDRAHGFILGDPVAGRFILFFTLDGGKHWGRVNTGDLDAPNAGIGAFAASNSALSLGYEGMPLFGTSGPDGPWLYVPDSVCTMLTAQEYPAACFDGFLHFRKVKLPLAGDSSSTGIFSIAFRPDKARFIVVGGDYARPDATQGTAASIIPFLLEPRVAAAVKPPHGYRSSVEWSESLHAWITAGANGSDISRDDGRTWQPIDNGNWNALSLPFVVGPNGRIARLDPSAIP
ncbi:MAG TPA: hypothetical protein VMA34_10945, partial [Terracidiphilus sp.]|nr:hypothetical protein [Terracidiphilus sp.]